MNHRRIAAFLAVLAALALPATATADPGFEAHGSALQAYAVGLPSKAQATLLGPDGRPVATKAATAEGGVLFRNIKPGSGYKISSGGQVSDALTVFGDGSVPPSTSVYNQDIAPSGYQYLTTRDGTKLAIDVHPQQDVEGAFSKTYPPGAPVPAPTLIEYSGYGYANPEGPESGIAAIANGLGFTVVDVNMRGTGCSGGAFDFFEQLQNLDGYDVIETIARQPWVLHNKVGMMGISYGGISQLFTAQTQPPSLAAITPLSVIDASATTLYPGGILNTGFALAWSKERQEQAKPAGPKTGQAWAYKRIQGGDETCKANQALHGQAVDIVKKSLNNNFYKPKVADPVSPVKFVDKIKVPVYMACQWEDEQTGGHCPTLAEHMTGTSRKWFTFTNGAHIDSLDPETFNRWFDFLMLYVAQEPPSMGAARVKAAGPLVYNVAMGINGVTMPDDPIQQEPTYDGALAAFEKLKSIRVLFDNGAGGNPGFPYPAFEHSWDSFPIPGATGRSWYLGAGGALADAKSPKAGSAAFVDDAKARPLVDHKGSTDAGDNGIWTATPTYDWQQPPAGTAASFMTAPLPADTVVVGAGQVDLWIRSSRPAADLQATVTEVRPDGKEMFVQSGWLRGDVRKIDAAQSRPLEPWLSLRKRDVSPIPKHRFVKATIPLYYEGHAYRKGSRIRVIISAPNGDQPIWSFSRTRPRGTANVTIGFSQPHPSRLVLPTVSGVDVPVGLPPCPGTRAEPCRDAPR